MRGENRPGSGDPTFDAIVLDRTVIARPLLKLITEEKARDQALQERAAGSSLTDRERRRFKEIESGLPEVYHVIIDLNLRHDLRPAELKEAVAEMIEQVIGSMRPRKGNDRMSVDREKTRYSSNYVFADLTARAIQELARRTQEEEPKAGSTKTPVVREESGSGHDNVVKRSIHHIWPDFEIRPLTNKTISTIKADAAQKAFGAFGQAIVWAVMDSGIDAKHPHFQRHCNLEMRPPLQHKSFCGGKADQDPFGHGTHVAGIIAGETLKCDRGYLVAVSRRRTENDDVQYELVEDIERMSGMAPETKLLSLKVLEDDGSGRASNLMAAIEYIQQLNGYGRELLVHGVNMSVGYDFEPEWFACGQSPLCVEVDRLVKSGVVVVVAAGNTGYGSVYTDARGSVAAGIGLTINDPGNSDLAITVGSTHRDMPHTYGVSYFSSKGPTGDGRLKPDLVAPGEKILSCASGARRKEVEEKAANMKKPDGTPVGEVYFVEDSGTSMAAPHVSGAVAAFLSIRPEFKGRPERVKEIFMDTATDLKRERAFQGSGLLDLMRAIQSV